MLKKLPIILLLLPALCSVESFAQQYQLSPRLGEVIDQNERDYFYLFPAVKGFVSAKTYIHGERKVDIIISAKQNGADTLITYTISRVLADNLATFVEGFESVRQKKAAVNWELLGLLVWNGAALESKIGDGNGVTILKRSGESISGTLLWADDSLVILWRSTEDYNWRLADRSAAPIRYTDIESISTTGNGKFWPGFEVGALIGGISLGGFSALYSNTVSGYVRPQVVLSFAAIGAISAGLIGGLADAVFSNDIDLQIGGKPDRYFYHALPILREKEMFPDHPPPELMQLTDPSFNRSGASLPTK